MSDHEIRTLFQTMAEDVQDIRPLEHSALRRARTRRLTLAVTAAACVLTVAVAGTGLALNAIDAGNPGSIAPVQQPDATPPPPNEMPGTIVAYGTTEDGREWWLSAYANDAGELCTDLQHETGRIVEDCSEYEHDDVGFAKDNDDENGTLNVFGWVPDDADGLWVTWGDDTWVEEGPEDEEAGQEDVEDEEEEQEDPDGDYDRKYIIEAQPSEDDSPSEGDGEMNMTIEGEEPVTLHDAPEGFPFPVKFYALLPAPDNADAIRIGMNNGNTTVIIISDRTYHLEAKVCASLPQRVDDDESKPEKGPNEETCVERVREE